MNSFIDVTYPKGMISFHPWIIQVSSNLDYIPRLSRALKVNIHLPHKSVLGPVYDSHMNTGSIRFVSI